MDVRPSPAKGMRQDTEGFIVEKKSSRKVLLWLSAFIGGFLLAAVPFSVVLFSGPKPPPPPRKAEPHAVHRAEAVTRDGTPASTPAAEGKNGIRIYYDGVHGARHLYNRDNRRFRSDYHTVSGWYRLLQGLRTAGYAIDAEDYACFDADSLAPYQVFMVGEQTYHARFMTDDERRDLVAWVRNGGGLFVTVEHTNAHYMSEVFNTLVKDMPIKARFDSICDTVTADPRSPDWMSFTKYTPHPVTEGVHDYSFDNGCSFETEFGVMWSSPESWSDKFDPKAQPVVHNGNKKRDVGELSGPLAGVAAFEFGKGRVVVIGDHNGLTNNSLYLDDHHRFAMNAIRWLAHAEDRDELVNWQYPAGYDLLIHTGADSEIDLHKKVRELGFRTFYGYLSKEPQLRPWASKTLRTGDDVLFLGAPRQQYSDDELNLIDQALAAGKPVIWLATLNSIRSAAGAQLKSHFEVAVSVVDDPDMQHAEPFEVHGPEEWTRGIFRIFLNPKTPQVHVEGLDPIVQLSWGTRHIQDKQWEKPDALIDLISVKEVGPGKLYVIAPFDLFDDRGLNELYTEGADVVRQQMAELMIRTAKIAIGDKTVYAD